MAGRTSLRVIDADGRRERILFTQRYGWMRDLARWADGAPAMAMWTPAGRATVFSRHHHLGEALWRVDADGGGFRHIAAPIPEAE